MHGHQSDFLESTTGGPQEKALNKLLTTLGITLEQEHIIGAHPIEPSSSSDKSPITRLTVNSRETKEKIRKAAEITRRWGSAGGHAVFLRDSVKRKRTSSNEDTKTPKKAKTEMEETPRSSRPKREEGLPRRRLEGDRPETRREERARTVGAAQTKLDAEKAEREKIRLEQLEARRAKLAHQDRETQDLINKQGQRSQKPKTREPENNKKKDNPKAIIKTFRALNESENEEEGRISPLYNDTQPWLYDDKPATQEAEPQEESENETENPGGLSMRRKPTLRLTRKRVSK